MYAHNQLSRIRLWTVALAALAAGGIATAATPPGGTLTDANKTLSYSAGPFVVSNPSAQATGTPVCTPGTCDDYLLTVNVAAADAATMQIRVEVQWPNPAADFDLYVLSGSSVACKSTSSADPEIAICPAVSGSYTVRVAPFAPLGQSFVGTIKLEPKSPGPPPPPPGIPPRYQQYQAPPGGGDFSGEPSIGVDPKPNVASLKHGKVNTGGMAFFTANFAELRVSFDDCSSPAKDLWEDKTSPQTSAGGLDPIGYVDQTTGRVFQSQLAGPAGSITAFSDDDGENWTPSQGGGQPAGVDHQTLGGGPYHAVASPPSHPTYPNAIYYCSQDVATAFCSRSDNGGLTFGPSVPVYNLTQCGGLHGHIKVAPDGTVYLPNKSCGTGQGVVVSEDNGQSWIIRAVPNSIGSGSDPSVGVATDGTLYFGYANGDGLARIAVSKNRGVSWLYDRDAGAPFGIQNTAFAEVVAGDPDRAAFAFLGSTTSGNLEDAGFSGTWYLYVAHTFDGGNSYMTLDAVKNDPVQIGCIWLSGGDNPCRNLLDFNDMTVDKEGRALVGYADGCVVGACGPGSPPAASRSAKGSIARQSGGRRLYQAYDPPEPAVPAAPALDSAARGSGGVLVTWSEPDNGGSALTGYKVYRGTVSGGETLLATINATKASYMDTTANPTTNYFYRVTAVNAVGEGPFCGELTVTAGGPIQSPCVPPGITVVTDATDDSTDALAQHDIVTISIAEPFPTSTGSDQLRFTMKVGDLSVIPPQSRWTIFFSRANGTEYFVNMSSDNSGSPAGVAFKYGHTSIGTGGIRTLTTDGDADAGSTFSSDGTIVILLSNSKITFNLNPPPATLPPPAAGEQLVNINGITQQTIGVLLLTLDSTGAGSYVLVGNAACQGHPPVARDDVATTPQNTPVTIDVLANDSDPDGDSLSVTGVTNGAHGSAARNANNTVTYTPAAGFIGTDTFTYTITDGHSNFATATVTVTVTQGAAGAPASPVQGPITDDAIADQFFGIDRDGKYRLNWSYPGLPSAQPCGFRVEEATLFNTVFTDDASATLVAGSNALWSGNPQWISTTHPDTGTSGYSILYIDNLNASLTMKAQILAFPGSATVLSFDSSEDTEPGADFGFVEVSTDGGTTFQTLASYTGMFSGRRSVNLSSFGGQYVKVRFRFTSNALKSAPLYRGWAIDNIQIESANFASIGTVGASIRTFNVTGRTGRDQKYAYRILGLFGNCGASPTAGPPSNVQTIRVDIATAPPTASFTYSPKPGKKGSPMTFDASSSVDNDTIDGAPNPGIVRYSWSFGDGSSLSTANAVSNHTYAAAGSYRVTLTVTDNDGERSSTAQTVSVVN